MREFRDARGQAWEALAVEEVVAHGKRGARLAFRPAGDGDVPLLSNVTFNSMDAAHFALRTLGEKELGRRLTLAQEAAGAP